MSDAGDTHGPCSLNLLLFSVGGVHFGVDADQVEGTFSCQGEDPDGLHWFHKELDYGDDTVVYGAPTILGIRTGDSHSYRVVIDMMEDVTGIVADDIHPFPPFVEPFALRKGIWGIVMRDDRMVLLVDFYRILKEEQFRSLPGDGNEEKGDVQ